MPNSSLALKYTTQDKENEVQEVKSKASRSIEELRAEIAILEDRLLNKTHEVKTLQSKLSYAVADHSSAYDLERNLRQNAQANSRVLEVKVRKSNEAIRKYKDEITSLKSELEHQVVLTRKYEQRSARLRKKLTEASLNAPTRSDSHEDVERMRLELREARLNKGSSAYYDIWRSECDNSRALRKELEQVQEEFEECDKELVQAQEDFTILTANSRAATQRLQKRIVNMQE
jgi:predicted  nucleic acid-binding Zn-ribbon protein